MFKFKELETRSETERSETEASTESETGVSTEAEAQTTTEAQTETEALAGAETEAGAEAETDLVRIARIGDSVFAVVITLLAYRVHIPDAQVLAAGELRPLVPFVRDLSALLMSFFVASMFWISHWRVFRRMQHSDLKYVALNIAYLGTLILLPISTSLVSAADGTRIGSVAYSVNLFCIATAGFFMRRHARRLDPQVFSRGLVLMTPVLLMLMFGGAAIVSLWWPALAPWIWGLTLVTPWIDNRWGVGRNS